MEFHKLQVESVTRFERENEASDFFQFLSFFPPLSSELCDILYTLTYRTAFLKYEN